jgi:hypothetical protein
MEMRVIGHFAAVPNEVDYAAQQDHRTREQNADLQQAPDHAVHIDIAHR